MYAQPVTLAERAQIARDWRKAHSFTSPVVIDWPDNRINADYAGTPERLYILDRAGIVTFKSEMDPYPDAHLDDWENALQAALGASTM